MEGRYKVLSLSGCVTLKFPYPLENSGLPAHILVKASTCSFEMGWVSCMTNQFSPSVQGGVVSEPS